MPRDTDDILLEINAFGSVDGNWLELERLLDELWDVGVPARALPILFGVFERFPEDDAQRCFGASSTE